MYTSHNHIQMVCQKLCQKNVSGWGTLQDSNFYLSHTLMPQPQPAPKLLCPRWGRSRAAGGSPTGQ